MKQIELLLLDNVDNLGIVGDVVKVRPGYARNFLVPRGLATTPTPGSIERLAERRAVVEAEMKAIRSAQQEMIGKLEEHEITMERSANEQGVLFGGVSQHDIAEALRADGFSVEDRWVRIGQQIKRLDSYQIPVVIDKELKTEVKLWVVSDKPAEELEAEGDAGEGDEVAAESADESASGGYHGRDD
ncbi:50S ribosomal protein L9 [Phycisphaerales bacterium AB-hyl4]|uniref:Large ribosomal subunit protein bL9 n=1 Tax=Natronomicrosphaera hydrolytica TaxID=3242702 RepID=A0ABV4U1S2_9BACT